MTALGIFFRPDGTVEQQHLGATPKRSTYQPGDRVQLHGYQRGLPGAARYGFRGFVLGGFGAALLRGLTDEGREWVYPAGWLVPDGQPERGGAWCVCCPHRERRPKRAAAAAATVQLDLFEVMA